MVLKIYMKSGNVIQLNNVTSCEVQRNTVEDSIVGLEITQQKGGFFSKPYEDLMIKSICLSNIEAITKIG